MTAALKPDPVAALAALPSDEFGELIRSSLGREASAQLWDALTHPSLRVRTKDCLSGILTDLLNQQQIAKAELEEIEADCLARGDEGRAEYLAAKADKADWRRRLVGYRRMVEARLSFVKDRTQRPVQTPSPYGRGLSNAARKHNRDALEKLARAVAEHRHRVMSGDGDESDDERLWACLEDVTAMNRLGDEMPLAEWLEHLDDLREDDEIREAS
jgi:hypothetical protein